MGNGYLYETSRGSGATFFQNMDHFYQCPLEAAALLVERPSEMLYAAVWKILRKLVLLAGSKVSMTASVGRFC